MDDVYTFDFVRRIKAGEYINNPCTYQLDEVVEGTGLSQFTDLNGARTITLSGNIHQVMIKKTNLPNFFTEPYLSLSEDVDLDVLKHKALSFVNSPKYDFGEPAYEIAETLRFIKNPLASVNRLVKSFSKKRDKTVSRFASISDRVKAAAEVWASYSFAARPLMQTINDAIDAYNDQTVTNSRRTSRTLWDNDEYTSSTTVHSFSGWKTNIQRDKEVHKEVHVGVTYENEDDYTIFAKLGLRGRDLPSTMWEVLPLSFMIDRVYNVKGFINGAINLLDSSVKINGGFITTRTEQVLRFKASHPTTHISTSTWNTHIADELQRRRFIYNRSPWVPSASDIIPRFKPRGLVSDLTKTADLVSLMVIKLL
jgi:hypothetical protein